jgi:hypothetical protein
LRHSAWVLVANGRGGTARPDHRCLELSATWTVGFLLIKVADIESGAVHVTHTSFWSD